MIRAYLIPAMVMAKAADTTISIQYIEHEANPVAAEVAALHGEWGLFYLSVLAVVIVIMGTEASAYYAVHRDEPELERYVLAGSYGFFSLLWSAVAVYNSLQVNGVV